MIVREYLLVVGDKLDIVHLTELALNKLDGRDMHLRVICWHQETNITPVLVLEPRFMELRVEVVLSKHPLFLLRIEHTRKVASEAIIV